MWLKFFHEFSYNSQFKKYNCQSTHSYNRNIWVDVPYYIIFHCSHTSVYFHLYSSTLIFRTPDYLISPNFWIISLDTWFFLTKHFQFTSDFSNFDISNFLISRTSFRIPSNKHLDTSKFYIELWKIRSQIHFYSFFY